MTILPCLFTAVAEDDLFEIAMVIAQDNAERARTFIQEIRSQCEGLVDHPRAYRLREEYGSGVRVAPFGKYLIFYALRDDALVIERILHGARHLDWVQI